MSTDPGTQATKLAPRRTDRRLTISLLVAQGLLSLVVIVISVLSGFMVDACTARCDFGLITFSGLFVLVGVVALFVAALLFSSGLLKAPGPAWWVPLTGIGLVIAVLFVSWLLLAAGLHVTIGEFFAPN